MALYDINGKGKTGFIDVTDFGAKGDGVTSDSLSIQQALDATRLTGGIIYFPKGSYLLTTGLLFYSNQTLWFETGATLLQGAAIDNLLMSYCDDAVGEYNGTHDTIIRGATFDGGAFTTNNTLVGTVHCKNITFENCTFKNAYGTWHDLEINSSYNVKVIGCDFEGSRKTGANGCMIQVDAINNVNTWPWTNRGLVDNTISKYIEIASCIFHDDTISPAIGNHSEATDDSIFIHDCIFNGLTSTRGAIKFNATNVDIYNNCFNGCTTGVDSGGATYHIRGNRFVGVTTVTTVDTSILEGNMINGEIDVNVKALETDVSELNDLLGDNVESTSVAYTIKGYINADGDFVENQYNDCSVYYSAKNILDITILGANTATGYACAFYDGAYNILGGLKALTTDATVLASDIPSGSAYVRFSSRSSYPATTTIRYSNNVLTDLREDVDAATVKVVKVDGTDPVITGEDNTHYICGEVTTLTITPPSSGGIDVLFTSGATATTLTMTGIVMPDGFTVEANRVYEINVYQGYGLAVSWEVSA